MMSEDATFKEEAVVEEEESAAVAMAEAIRVRSCTDDTTPAAVEEESSNNNIIRIVPIQDTHLPQVCDLLREAFQNKKCLLCMPVDESLEELQQRYEEMPEAKRRLGAVAINDKNNTVVGHVQMTARGLPVYPEDFHTCQRDEMYIETVAVAEEARGRGIGTRLLEWCHATALEHPQISRLQLEVLRGNRAIRLYDRFGFDIKPLNNCLGECCGAILLCCYYGRPYGMCRKEWGAVEMELLIEREEE